VSDVDASKVHGGVALSGERANLATLEHDVVTNVDQIVFAEFGAQYDGGVATNVGAEKTVVQDASPVERAEKTNASGFDDLLDEPPTSVVFTPHGVKAFLVPTNDNPLDSNRNARSDDLGDSLADGNGDDKLEKTARNVVVDAELLSV
jgi:hypothetical protein